MIYCFVQVKVRVGSCIFFSDALYQFTIDYVLFLVCWQLQICNMFSFYRCAQVGWRLKLTGMNLLHMLLCLQLKMFHNDARYTTFHSRLPSMLEKLSFHMSITRIFYVMYRNLVLLLSTLSSVLLAETKPRLLVQALNLRLEPLLVLAWKLAALVGSFTCYSFC